MIKNVNGELLSWQKTFLFIIKTDIITANIVANAILSLAPAVPGLMAEGATFIASGIIDSRKDEVIAGLEKAGLSVVEVKEKRGWECIVCKKA